MPSMNRYQLAKGLGVAAAGAMIVLWVVFLFFNPYDGGFRVGLVAEGMLLCAVVALMACLHGSRGWMVALFVVSFVPVGLYLLGTPGVFLWIGVANLLYLASAVWMTLEHRWLELRTVRCSSGP